MRGRGQSAISHYASTRHPVTQVPDAVVSRAVSWQMWRPVARSGPRMEAHYDKDGDDDDREDDE
jgi:hypothetical protein